MAETEAGICSAGEDAEDMSLDLASKESAVGLMARVPCRKWCSRAHIPSDSPTWGHSHSWSRNPRQMLAQLHAPFQRLSQAPCTAHSSD